MALGFDLNGGTGACAGSVGEREHPMESSLTL